MSEQLRQPYQVVAVVGQVLMRHRMPEKVRVQGDADEGRILGNPRPIRIHLAAEILVESGPTLGNCL